MRRSDEELLRAFAARLAGVGDDEAAALLAGLIERMRVERVGAVVEKLTPRRPLDYGAHEISLIVSSSEIAVRLKSVEKEPFTVEWIEQSLRPGDVFYDIGANVGAYSLIAAKTTGNRARIYAFEPAPASFLDLTRNVETNACAECVVSLPVALWSENQILSLSSSLPVAGAAGHQIGPRGTAGSPESVAAIGVRLDDLVHHLGLPVPTHAKIDTDGNELDVLRGAELTLRRAEWRSVLIELDRDETSRNGQIRAALAEAGFDTARKHLRVATPGFPRPEGRPDVYWTFSRSKPLRVRAPRSSGSTPIRRAQRRAVAATVGIITCLFLLLVFLPEQLGDRPYDVFGLRF